MAKHHIPTSAITIKAGRKPKPEPFLHHDPVIATRGPYAGQPKSVKEDGKRHITRDQIINAHNAYSFAIDQGTRLNTFVTIMLVKLKGSKGWQKGVASAALAAQVSRQRARILRSLNVSVVAAASGA